jgi:hypothetical protein
MRGSVREIVLTTYAWPLGREQGETGRSVQRSITMAPWMAQGSVVAASNSCNVRAGVNPLTKGSKSIWHEAPGGLRWSAYGDPAHELPGEHGDYGRGQHPDLPSADRSH